MPDESLEEYFTLDEARVMLDDILDGIEIEKLVRVFIALQDATNDDRLKATLNYLMTICFDNSNAHQVAFRKYISDCKAGKSDPLQRP